MSNRYPYWSVVKNRGNKCQIDILISLLLRRGNKCQIDILIGWLSGTEVIKFKSISLWDRCQGQRQ